MLTLTRLLRFVILCCLQLQWISEGGPSTSQRPVSVIVSGFLFFPCLSTWHHFAVSLLLPPHPQSAEQQTNYKTQRGGGGAVGASVLAGC